MNLKQIMILGFVFTAILYVFGMLQGYMMGWTDPALTFGFPLVQGLVMAVLFIIVYVKLLKKKSV